MASYEDISRRVVEGVALHIMCVAASAVPSVTELSLETALEALEQDAGLFDALGLPQAAGANRSLVNTIRKAVRSAAALDALPNTTEGGDAPRAA